MITDISIMPSATLSIVKTIFPGIKVVNAEIAHTNIIPTLTISTTEPI